MEQSGISLDRMRTFVRIAERGNLSGVARETGAGQSTITRHLRELEDALGVVLLRRTTRRVSLTEEGTRYYGHCQQILGLVEEAQQELRATGRSMAGSVRISCTAALGVLHVSQSIFDFQDEQPDIRIAFNLTDDRVDLVQDDVDIAIRLGPLTDSAMRLRSLGTSQRVLVAAPMWVERYGAPRRPADLAERDGVRLSRVLGSDRLVLQGKAKAGKPVILPFHARLNVDHGLALREALLAGRGYGPAHLWLVEDCLADGRLTRLLPSWALMPVPMSMLIAPERANLARVRLCADFLSERIKRLPGIRR